MRKNCKKLVSLILVMVMAFCVSSCNLAGGSTTPPQNANVYQQDTVEPTTTEKQPTEIALTTANIEEYLTITYDVHDVTKKNTGGVWSADGKLTIKTSPKKRGDFNNVVITVIDHRTSTGWEDYGGERILEIPFDGKFEQTINVWGYVFRGNNITTTPVFKLEVVSVSGTFIEP